MKPESVNNEWRNFCKYVIQKNRYILTARWKKFTKEIISWAKKREHPYQKNTNLWRARIGSKIKVQTGDVKVGALKDKDLYMPPRNKSLEGRANPEGVPYFYLACEDTTAIYEVRPHRNQHVTVATFKLIKDVKVIDALSSPLLTVITKFAGKDNLSSAEREELIWAYINNAFSIPIAPEDNHCDYVPTQYLAELFKNEGYDGVLYRSAIKQDGANVVLFDCNVAVIECKRVFSIKKILYEPQEVGLEL